MPGESSIGESHRTRHGRLAEEGRVGDDENTKESSTGDGCRDN